MRDTNFKTLDLGTENTLRDICGISGENTHLESAMYILDSLMGWCELCFNNEIELKDYELLTKAYKILEEVHESYSKNYN